MLELEGLSIQDKVYVCVEGQSAASFQPQCQSQSQFQTQSQLHSQLMADSHQLQRYVKRHAVDVQDAADIYQESIVRVMERARASVIHNPIAYAIRTARNLLITKSKQDDMHSDELGELVCPEKTPEELLFGEQRTVVFKQFLAGLPALRREVLLRRRMKGESRLEIANALNISEDAVKKHISRALSDLQRFVDEHQLN